MHGRPIAQAEGSTRRYLADPPGCVNGSHCRRFTCRGRMCGRDTALNRHQSHVGCAAGFLRRAPIPWNKRCPLIATYIASWPSAGSLPTATQWIFFGAGLQHLMSGCGTPLPTNRGATQGRRKARSSASDQITDNGVQEKRTKIRPLIELGFFVAQIRCRINP